MKKDETCPADILLLDSNEIKDKEAVCYVDTYLVDGRGNKIKKKATGLTKSNKIYYF